MSLDSKNIVLVVDDEPIVLRMATAALATAGYRVLVAENGLAGLECFLHSSNEVCVVLADVVMPIMGGVEMAERIVEHAPDVKVLLITGYTNDVVRPQCVQKFPLIHKPFLPDDLIRKIKGLLNEK